MKEILLEVKFAEVDRAAVSHLGVNILRQFGSNMPISTSTGSFLRQVFKMLLRSHYRTERRNHGRNAAPI